MVSIIKFKINGFKSSNRECSISFDNHPCSVIYGQNGIGKTTLLQIMSAFFSKTESVLLSNKVSYIECSLRDDNDNIHEIKCTLKEGKGFWEHGTYEEFDQLTSLSIGTERGIAQQNTSINPVLIFDFLYRFSNFSLRNRRKRSSHPRDISRADDSFRMEMRDLAEELASYLRSNNRKANYSSEVSTGVAHINLKSIKIENIEKILTQKFFEARYNTTKNIQAALFETISALMDNKEIKIAKEIDVFDFLNLLKKYRERIKSALELGITTEFTENVINTLDRYCSEDSAEKLTISPAYFYLFSNIIRELDAENKSGNAVNLVLSLFNDILEFDKKIIINGDKSMYVEVGGEKHGIDELSSGERHMLTFLTLISTTGKNRNFVFIDEPEISLNLKWQRKILSIIQKILPETQIIVASHSPAICDDHTMLCKLVVS